MGKWEDIVNPAQPGTCTTAGNRIEHLWHDNRAVYRLWEAIEAAQERVWMSMYTLAPDSVGQGTLDRMTAAARRGCHVCLLYDGVGSYALRERHVADLRAAGGEVTIFNRAWPPWKLHGPLHIRNHRKLITIDHDVAFCGGMNLSEDFAGDDFGDDWIFDDTVVCLSGPCVRDLAAVFARTWHANTGEDLPLPPRAAPHPDGAVVEVLETDPRRGETRLREVIDSAIQRSEMRCRITTPYFIPDTWLQEAILKALGNGAVVEILTAGRTDAAVARLAGHYYYERLLRAGARIFEMQSRIIHTKKVSIDDAFCAVGSYNFDLWTSRHVLDASIATIDERLAASFEKEFDDDLQYVKEIEAGAWRHTNPLSRLAQWTALKACQYL